jgi:uncharacterized membrane protein YphA (DoxX/SURF4 family)
MKKLFLLLAAGLAAVKPAIASAHVKWFVDTESTIEQFHTTTKFYEWNSPAVLAWCAIAILIICIFHWIDTITPLPKKLLAFGQKNSRTIHRIAEIILGLFLVTVSFVWKVVLVPNIHVENNFTSVLMLLQALIGAMFIFNIWPRVAAVGLLIFCAGLGIHEGLVAVLENAILISLALYFYVRHSPKGSTVEKKWGTRSLDVLRIGTGISLIVLAFTEKLMYPELSLQFLSLHHWNFMYPMFPWFTDNLFVLSTGFAELIFGVLFIFGYVTRVTTILIALFFATSVTTMLVQTGAWEVEDLVVYSAAILFIFLSEGKTLFKK